MYLPHYINIEAALTESVIITARIRRVTEGNIFTLSTTGGVPTLDGGQRGYLPWVRGTYHEQEEGYLPWMGVPTLGRGRGTYPGLGGGTYPGQGKGVPTLYVGGTYPRQVMQVFHCLFKGLYQPIFMLVCNY